jgi:hypothetical protein
VRGAYSAALRARLGLSLCARLGLSLAVIRFVAEAIMTND